MRIDFIDNNTVVASTDKLIDIDLSYYDNVLVSKPVAPEVRFTIAYNHLDNNDPFVTWWKTITQGEIPENVFAVIYDGNGYEVASGDLFEYDEDLQNFALEILIVPGFTQILDEEKNKSGEIVKPITHDASLNYITGLLREVFLNMWNKLNIPYSCILNDPTPNGVIWMDFIDVANIIHYFCQSRLLSGNAYFLRINYVLNGTKANSINSLGFSNLLKLFYSRKSNSFSSWNPQQTKQVQGFVTGTSYNELDTDDFSPLYRLRVYDYGGDDEIGDLDSLYKAKIQQKVNSLKVRKNYHIQGNVAFTWLYPGDSISLNGQTYIIKEINYDPVSLNTISHMGSNLNLKFFNAVCVKGS